MQGAPTEEIIRVVNLCPTDALTYKRNDALTSETPDLNTGHKPPDPVTETLTELRIMQDGPLVVKGNFTIA